MTQSSTLRASMRPLADMMMEKGAELSLADEQGNSACTLLFQSYQGIQYIGEHVYHYFDVDIYDDLRNADYWLISTMARCMPMFKRHLEAQLRDYRTPREISSDMRPRQEHLMQLDEQQQISWLKNAKKEDRMAFMRTICAHGTLRMVQPFIDSGIDLNETSSSSEKTYIRHAASLGNLKIVHALSKAGACLDQEELYDKNWALTTSVVDDLIERWHAVRIGRLGFGWGPQTPESEHGILASLMQNPSFKGPNALICALWWDESASVVQQLLDFGCGRRDGQPPGTHYVRMLGSEVIEAVKMGSPHLKAMLDAGLGLECEDRLGVTALLHALDMGLAQQVELLIQAGANLTRETGYGITPLEFAKSNLAASHPRPMQRAWINKNELKNRQRKVELEQDQKTYDLLNKAIQDRDRVGLPFRKFRSRIKGTVLRTHVGIM